MTSKIKLLPCPFCGGTAEYGAVPLEPSIPAEYQPNYGGHFVTCAACDASTVLVFNTMGDDIRAILREKWNRRAPARSDAVARLVEACRDLIELQRGIGGPKPKEVRKAQAALAAVEKEMQP